MEALEDGAGARARQIDKIDHLSLLALPLCSVGRARRKWETVNERRRGIIITVIQGRTGIKQGKWKPTTLFL